MTMTPSALPVSGSSLNAPLLSLKVPCTVWRVEFNVQWIEVVAGWSLKLIGWVSVCAPAATANRNSTRKESRQ